MSQKNRDIRNAESQSPASLSLELYDPFLVFIEKRAVNNSARKRKSISDFLCQQRHCHRFCRGNFWYSFMVCVATKQCAIHFLQLILQNTKWREFLRERNNLTLFLFALKLWLKCTHSFVYIRSMTYCKTCAWKSSSSTDCTKGDDNFAK